MSSFPFRLIVALAFAISFCGAVEIILAGFPISLSEPSGPNYTKVYELMRDHNITGLLPFYQYKEVPEFKTLGYEADFVECNPNSTQIRLLKEYGIKIFISSSYYYDANGVKPGLPATVLKDAIDCIGRENVLGIYNVDEPAWRETKDGIDRVPEARTVYNAVKALDPTLDVFIVHAPCPGGEVDVFGNFKYYTCGKIDAYFEKVKKYTPYCDVCGFDIYAIPYELFLYGSPYVTGVYDYDVLYRDYTRWIQQHMASKKLWMVLQGHSLAHLMNLYPDPRGPLPNATQTKTMVEISAQAGVNYIGWYGQSFLNNSADEQAHWQRILSESKNIVLANYPMHFPGKAYNWSDLALMCGAAQTQVQMAIALFAILFAFFF